jgi:hypothetical protein
MNHNPFAAGSVGGINFGTAMTMPRLTLDSADTNPNAIDFTFGGALDNLPEGVDKGKAFEMLMNDALANKRSKESTSELRELLEYAGNPERQKQILDMTQGFQKEQIAEAAKYKALFGLPKQIMDSFTIPAAIAATGDIAAANMLAQAGTNIGQLYGQGVKPMQVNVPTVNYGFGR